jgi:hypothetical protein
MLVISFHDTFTEGCCIVEVPDMQNEVKAILLDLKQQQQQQLEHKQYQYQPEEKQLQSSPSSSSESFPSNNG